MSRIAGPAETQREKQEGDLASLGTCLVFIGMVRERVRLASKIIHKRGLLEPAVEDLTEIERRIRKVQEGLAER